MIVDIPAIPRPLSATMNAGARVPASKAVPEAESHFHVDTSEITRVRDIIKSPLLDAGFQVGLALSAATAALASGQKSPSLQYHSEFGVNQIEVHGVLGDQGQKLNLIGMTKVGNFEQPTTTTMAVTDNKVGSFKGSLKGTFADLKFQETGNNSMSAQGALGNLPVPFPSWGCGANLPTHLSFEVADAPDNAKNIHIKGTIGTQPYDVFTLVPDLGGILQGQTQTFESRGSVGGEAFERQYQASKRPEGIMIEGSGEGGFHSATLVGI